MLIKTRENYGQLFLCRSEIACGDCESFFKKVWEIRRSAELSEKISFYPINADVIALIETASHIYEQKQVGKKIKGECTMNLMLLIKTTTWIFLLIFYYMYIYSVT